MVIFLLYLILLEFRRMNMDLVVGVDYFDFIISLIFVGYVIGLDFDAEEDYVYYIDISYKIISRVKWDGI